MSDVSTIYKHTHTHTHHESMTVTRPGATYHLRIRLTTVREDLPQQNAVAPNIRFCGEFLQHGSKCRIMQNNSDDLFFWGTPSN